MTKQITAANAKNNFGTLLEEVYINKNTVTILRNNKPVAKLIPIIKNTEMASKAMFLSDSEYKDFRKGQKEFRKTFKLSF